MVSVIIPTWNEAACIAETIRSLRLQGPVQIIVADGGSVDDTVGLAKEADRVVTAPLGRAFQMNAGAAAATGDFLLFLHADCRLEEGAIRAVGEMLAKPGVLAGCFSMRINAPGWGFRVIDACATARVRFTGVVYGDQGLFMRRDDFLKFDGFPKIRFMEDVFFSSLIASRGRVVVAKEQIFVSERRWRKVGLIRQTLRNWTLTALALGGISPDQLARYYPQVR